MDCRELARDLAIFSKLNSKRFRRNLAFSRFIEIGKYGIRVSSVMSSKKPRSQIQKERITKRGGQSDPRTLQLRAYR